ncbi:MAG TPA: LysR family transcriptional regulator [Burkholderiaceae bacterium]|nr:LysR family transcriptional regulator [Burkholderiaceae bacterium]
MHINELDLNLLRIFDAVYRQRSVSRAADALALSQPAVSQGLTRLRLVLKDALFTRAGRGVAPTATADALARAVPQALQLIGQALHAAERFDPAATRRTFHLHMSDIGESEFLPDLMQRVRRVAPGARIETRQLEYGQIENALDTGKIDLAFGYLPGVEKTQSLRLFTERYVVIARADHPVLTERPSRRTLAQLEYVVVRQHSETTKLLDRLGLNDNIRLSTPHFMVTPAIVGATDLAVVLPLRIATKFAQNGRLRIVQPRWGQSEFGIDLHWSYRAQHDPANRWLRQLAVELFREPVTSRASTPRARS